MLFNICVTAPKRPVMKFTIDGTEYEYIGEDVDISGKLKISNDGNKGWKMWIYDSLSLAFSFINTEVDICAVGHGQAAGNAREVSYGGGWVDIFLGTPGRGGQVLNESKYTGFMSGDILDVNIGSETTAVQKRKNTIIKRWTPTTGGGANGGGEVIHHFEPVDPEWAEGGGDGSNGSYAFGDPTFDEIMYGPGGCDSGYTPGRTYYAPGFGGIADTSDAYKKAGGKGIVIVRYKG